VRERGLQLVKQAFGSGEGFRTHDSILECSAYWPATFLRPRKRNWSDQALAMRLRPRALAV
jgi:hypothetical protein